MVEGGGGEPFEFFGWVGEGLLKTSLMSIDVGAKEGQTFRVSSAMWATWSRSCSAVSLLEARARVKRQRIQRESLSMSWLVCCQVMLMICWRDVIMTGSNGVSLLDPKHGESNETLLSLGASEESVMSARIANTFGSANVWDSYEHDQ